MYPLKERGCQSVLKNKIQLCIAYKKPHFIYKYRYTVKANAWKSIQVSPDFQKFAYIALFLQKTYISIVMTFS